MSRPRRQSIHRCFTKKLAVIIRTRLLHPAGLPQLTHAGIIERVAGTAAVPCLEIIGAVPPRISIEIRSPVTLGKRRKIIEEVMSKLSPADLAQELARAISFR